MGEAGATGRGRRWINAVSFVLFGAIAVGVAAMFFALPTGYDMPRRTGQAGAVLGAFALFGVLAWRVERLRTAFIASGEPDRSARSRAAWRSLSSCIAPLVVATAALWGVQWAGLLSGPRTMAGSFIAGFVPLAAVVAPSMLIGLVIGLTIVGRVVGDGRHCSRCGYPAVDPRGRCTECGSSLGARRAMTEGRIERPAWLVALAIVLAAGVLLFVFNRELVARAAPNAMLLRAAATPSLGMSRDAVRILESRTLTAGEQSRLASAVLDVMEYRETTRFLYDQTLLRLLVAGVVCPDDIDRLVSFVAEQIDDSWAQQYLTHLLRTPLTGSQMNLLAGAIMDEMAHDPSLGHLVGEWLVRAWTAGSLSGENGERVRGTMRDAWSKPQGEWVSIWSRAALATSSGQQKREIVEDCLAVLRQDQPPRTMAVIRRDVVEEALRLGMISEDEAEDLRWSTPRRSRSRTSP